MTQRLEYMDSDSIAAVAIATAAATLPFPPTAGQCAVVPSSWGSKKLGAVPKFDLDLWGAAALSLTGAELWGGKLRALTIADTTIDSVDHTTDTFTKAAHGWLTGDGPVRLDWATTPATGVSEGTDYWIIKTGANTFKIATSLANALAGTAVAFSSNGTGALTLSDVQGSADSINDTKRVRWGSRGLLDPTIALDVDKSYTIRCGHSPGVVAYAVTGTLSASSVTGTIVPVQGR